MKSKPVKKKGGGLRQKNSIPEYWIIAAILLITSCAFFPSLKNGLVNWDDFGYLRDNSIVKDFSFKNIKHVFNTNTDIKGNYHPLTILSYIIEYHFFKLNPFYFHLTNVLLHLVNVLLVYVFIKMIAPPSPKGGISGASTPPFAAVAAITALLFGIHPLRVESVTWVSERKDVLYTVFFLAALICYLLYLKKPQVKFYIFSFILFILSILSKGQAVVLAPVLVLVDFFVRRKFDKKLWLDKIPFFALAIIFGIIATKAQHTQLTQERLEYYTFFQRILIASYGLLMYLYKFFLPVKLACFYSYPASISGFFFIAPFVVLGLFVLLLMLGRKNNIIVFGFLFFLITISIVLQLLPVGDAVIAERYTYIPYLGLFFSAANVYATLLKQKQLRTILIAGGAAYIIWFFVKTFNQTKVWKDSGTLWTSVIENYPETAVAYADRGLEYYEHNEFEKAYEDFSNAIKYKKGYYEAYNNRGLTYRNLHKYEAAVADFQMSFKLNPEYIIAAFNCGLAYMDLKKSDSAIYYFNTVLKAEPDNPEYYYNIAVAYAAKGDNEMSIENYSKTIELKPNHEGAYNNRGYIHSHLRQYDKAIADFTHSIEINSNNPLAFANRSAANYESHNYKAALADALAAKSLGNDMGTSYIELLKTKQ